MKTRIRRQGPRIQAATIVREWMKEAESPIDHVAVTARARVFAIELLAIRCGWARLEKELEEWREGRIKNDPL